MFKTNRTAILPAAIMMIFAASPAQAGHKCYKYTGHCHNFAGEAHMIDALLHLDNAYYANCSNDRRSEISAAKHEIIFAMRDICCGKAKRELILALGPMSQYAFRPDECLLDDASAHILRALEFESLVHHPPVIRHQRPVYNDVHHYRHKQPSVSFGGKGWTIRIGF